ncbi:MAG TPA: response regulator, partial [Luteitalea sp.]|nr:response regulator [Luteitalea sp.]
MNGVSTLILVVDDNVATRYSTSRVLRAAGFEVIEAANGLDALTAAGHRPDLVILDVDLPDLDGFAVCRQLRASPVTARTPVLHLSAAFTRDLDKVHGLDAGADGYMTHPVEPPVLVATVNAFLRTRRAEEALRASEARFMTVFERTPTGIALLDVDTILLDVNPAVCRHLGRTRDEIVGHRLADLLPDGAGTTLAAGMRAVWAEGAWVGVLPMQHDDGRIVHLEWNLSRHSVPDTCLAMTTDVTERRDIEAEREQLLRSERAARSEAERANRLKDDFLAVLSHELRTPLNAVVGWSHVLRTQTSTAGPEVTRAVTAIERNARVQAQLIADLLDVSRIASGKLQLDRQLIDPGPMLEAAVTAVAGSAEERGVIIELE